MLRNVASNHALDHSIIDHPICSVTLVVSKLQSLMILARTWGEKILVLFPGVIREGKARTGPAGVLLFDRRRENKVPSLFNQDTTPKIALTGRTLYK